MVLCTIGVHIVENRALFTRFSVMQAVLPRLSSTTDPVLWRKSYSRPSSSSCHNAATASDGIRRVGAKSALLRFRLRRNLRPLPCASFPRLKRFAGLIRWPRFGDWREKVPAYSRPSSSSCHNAATASDGIRQSPRGDRATEPTLGPSARQLRLNCWEKKRR